MKALNPSKFITNDVSAFGWIDKNTYLIAFETIVDKDGDECHLEAEFWGDENKFVASIVYEDSGQVIPTKCTKKIKDIINKQMKNNL